MHQVVELMVVQRWMVKAEVPDEKWAAEWSVEWPEDWPAGGEAWFVEGVEYGTALERQAAD